MKKIFLFLAIVFCLSISAQITYNHSANTRGFLVKLHVSGYKYYTYNLNTINIYNVNHTLFKSISIPPPYNTPGGSHFMHYISENLFDSDNGIEYIMQRTQASPSYTCNLSVLDESGAVIFSKDSAYLGTNLITFSSYTSFMDQEPIYYDGTGTKLSFDIYNSWGGTYLRSDVYNLPGTIPCNNCTSGITTLITNPTSNPAIEDPKFFPNPTSDQLKLKYKLPDGAHLAEMKIYDLQGKLVDEFKVTDNFDFIYLPTNYNNGLYLYSLIVDGKVVKTEKIVLNK